ncbi:MAG: hypothetical protein LBV32_08510 [Tannerellaceae bacterium]|nr:hypothetical protein [Tannerellaceae bacterium]
MKKILILFLSILFPVGNAQNDRTANRWKIDDSGSITWTIDSRIPHDDHIEMSGERISTVLRYGVDAKGAFTLERSFVWPMLRTIPNNTHASLMRRFGWNIIGDMLTINGRRVADEKVKSITLDGVMTVVSEFELPRNGKIELTRYLFPSTQKAAYCEKYAITNAGQQPFVIEVPEARSITKTDPQKGVDGEYEIEALVGGIAGRTVSPGESVVFYADFKAFRKGEQTEAIDVEKELSARKNLIGRFWGNLILETPNRTINTMFAFAKIRGAESIYKTKGGYMHGPGGESYYAALWANDQAEYINPFFPYLGYDTGNKSAYNSYKHFARFMNDGYKPIPSSIVAEGTDIWNGAGDRGDAAMIAYGVARYSLSRGDKEEALELWPLLEWCLEYCRRNLNEDGVVTSDSDELENRFPAGDANLCTSSLYYDALISAVYLGKELGKSKVQLSAYTKQAGNLRKAIDLHFGGTVEGFDTYQYYKGNDVLRSWICMPLTVGIYDRKEETIKALFSPRLWTRDGLLTQAGSETFWDRSTLYALRGVFECGETAKGIDYLSYYSNQRLLGEHVPYAIEAWPEGNQRHLSAESGLYCRIITEGMFGIRPTGLHAFTLTPRLPVGWDYMNLRKVKAFNDDFDIEISRDKELLNIRISRNNKTIFNKNIKEGNTVTVKF